MGVGVGVGVGVGSGSDPNANPNLELRVAQPALFVDLVAAQVEEVVGEDGRELGQERGHQLVHLVRVRARVRY